MNIYLQTLIETSQIVLPIFFLLSCGYILRAREIINQEFVDQSSKLVFTVALPLLIFLNVAQADLTQLLSPGKLIYIAAATAGAGAFYFFIALKFIQKPEDQGVFAQSSFRSNFAIIGLAIIQNMFGDTGLAMGSLVLMITIPLYNLMSVIFLTLPFKGGMRPSSMIKSIVTNPLILAVFFALPFSYFDWHIPQILSTTGSYFSDMTLPLALLAVGASLDHRYLISSSTLALHSTFIKILWQPLVLTYGAWLMGFSHIELAVLFIFFGSPAATSGFMMVKNMGGNATLAANVVALSTILSMFTLTTGIFILKLLSV